MAVATTVHTTKFECVVCVPAMWLAVLQARQTVLFIACAAFYERRLVKHLAQHTMQ